MYIMGIAVAKANKTKESRARIIIKQVAVAIDSKQHASVFQLLGLAM
jgi:hypothetical protein